MWYVVESVVPKDDNIELAGSFGVVKFNSYNRALSYIRDWFDRVENSEWFDVIYYSGAKLIVLENDPRMDIDLYHIFDIQHS